MLKEAERDTEPIIAVNHSTVQIEDEQTSLQGGGYIAEWNVFHLGLGTFESL